MGESLPCSSGCPIVTLGAKLYFLGRIVSLAMANAAVVGVFTQIPILSEYAFWILVGAYFIWLAVPRRAKDRFKPLLILSILLILVAVVAVFVEIPIVSDYAFWIMEPTIS